MNAPRTIDTASPRARQGSDHSVRTLAVLLLAAALILAVTGCAGKRTTPDTPGPESLVTATGAPLAQPDFMAGLAKADYILAGEEHPNPCDHQAQAGLIRRLVANGLRPVIGLEMVPADRQDILDAFNAGKLATADLPGALGWKAIWGYAFDLYEPIFEAAREYHLPLFALNAPQGLAREVGRQGIEGISPAKRAQLPGALLPPDPAQINDLREIFAAHAAMRQKAASPEKQKAKAEPATQGDDPAFTRFMTVQSLWDTQMAQRSWLARARFDRPVVVIAGGGHVERGWGIARRLARLDPGARVVTVMPWRGGEAPDPESAQFFFACPAMQRTRLGLTLSHEPAPSGQPPAPLLVTTVSPGSPAAAAGVLAGDAVTAAGGHAATDLAVLHTAAIEAAKAGKPLTLTIARAGETLTIAIPLAEPKAGK